jgi:hypothetical protein
MEGADQPCVTPVAAPTAAVESATRDTAPVDCLYVVVDIRSDRQVADFLTEWSPCCDLVSVETQTVRRPASALVVVVLRHCCSERERSLRLVFDVRRDRDALENLVESGTVVVASRPFGAFANAMATYRVDAGALRAAIDTAEAAHPLAKLERAR